MANRINYRSKGWELIGNGADFEYRSEHICPNNWISQYAENKDGRYAKIWWYVTPDRMNVEDGADLVRNWDKCSDIEEISQEDAEWFGIT